MTDCRFISVVGFRRLECLANRINQWAGMTIALRNFSSLQIEELVRIKQHVAEVGDGLAVGITLTFGGGD